MGGGGGGLTSSPALNTFFNFFFCCCNPHMPCLVAIVDCTLVGSATTFQGLGMLPRRTLVDSISGF